MPASLTLSKSISYYLNRRKQWSPTLFAFGFLVFIGLMVFVQHYVKYAQTTEFAPKLSFYYNLIIYSSFALFTSAIIWVSKHIPFNPQQKTKSIATHLGISVLTCLLHMMLCNVVLFAVDLVSAVPFLPFIMKYLTGVIQIHFLVYWAVHGIVSFSRTRDGSKEKFKINGKFKVSMYNEQYYVPYDKVYWIEAFDHYQKLHAKDGYHIIKGSMKSLEKMVSTHQFCRVHRSYFVNTSKVKSIYRSKEKGCFVKLNDTLSLKVSESYRKQLMDVLQHQN